MRKGKIIRFINTISSDGIAYFLLHLFQLMGQDFHVAADLLVGYPGIYPVSYTHLTLPTILLV